jgi:D-galactarolactone cycloisomerase
MSPLLTLSRRELLRRATIAPALASVAAARARAHAPPFATAGDAAPLLIDRVEAFVLRTPPDKIPFDAPIELPPVGAMTGGPGIWNRLDHATPTRFKQYEQATLVKITTKSGLVGWGECHSPSAPRMHQHIISDLFAPLLRGQDARRINPLWERLYTTERVRGYSTGAHVEALAGVDLALWDLLGHALELPVYQLLGGKFRNGIPMYSGVDGSTPKELAKSAEAAVVRGLKVVKMGFRKGEGSGSFDRVQAVSEVMKRHNGEVCIDSLGAFKLYEAVQVGRLLDKLGNIGWFEDALLAEDASGYPILASSIETPICVGEMMSNRFQIRDILVAKGAHIFNPDVCRAGGITECQRIAALVDAYGGLWTPHVSTGTILYFAASLHLAVATSNCLVMEGGNKLERPFGNALSRTKFSVEKGVALVPDRPGFGVEFDEAALKAVTVG